MSLFRCHRMQAELSCNIIREARGCAHRNTRFCRPRLLGSSGAARPSDPSDGEAAVHCRARPIDINVRSFVQRQKKAGGGLLSSLSIPRAVAATIQELHDCSGVLVHVVVHLAAWAPAVLSFSSRVALCRGRRDGHTRRLCQAASTITIYNHCDACYRLPSNANGRAIRSTKHSSCTEWRLMEIPCAVPQIPATSKLCKAWTWPQHSPVHRSNVCPCLPSWLSFETLRTSSRTCMQSSIPAWGTLRCSQRTGLHSKQAPWSDGGVGHTAASMGGEPPATAPLKSSPVGSMWNPKHHSAISHSKVLPHSIPALEAESNVGAASGHGVCL